MYIRPDEYIMNIGVRKNIHVQFEKQLISNALLGFKWTKHIEMGCEVTQQGHLDDISALDLDDGDQMLILASHSGSVSVANFKYLGRKKWKKPMTLNLKRQSLKTIKWCPLDLRLFMVSTASGWMRVCDVTMEKEIQGKQLEGEVYYDWNEYNTTNSKVIVADASQSMKLVDFRIGMSLPHNIRWNENVIDVVQWYPSKHHFFYAGRRDGTIAVFDIRNTREPLAHKKLHNTTIYGLRLAPDGQRVISADRSGYIHVADTWDFSTQGTFNGDFALESLRRPDLKMMEGSGGDLYVATNFRKLTVAKFTRGSTHATSREFEVPVLADKPIVFRKSSYQLITGFSYNFLNMLSLDNVPEED